MLLNSVFHLHFPPRPISLTPIFFFFDPDFFIQMNVVEQINRALDTISKIGFRIDWDGKNKAKSMTLPSQSFSLRNFFNFSACQNCGSQFNFPTCTPNIFAFIIIIFTYQNHIKDHPPPILIHHASFFPTFIS